MKIGCGNDIIGKCCLHSYLNIEASLCHNLYSRHDLYSRKPTFTPALMIWLKLSLTEFFLKTSLKISWLDFDHKKKKCKKKQKKYGETSLMHSTIKLGYRLSLTHEDIVFAEVFKY